MIEEWTEAVRRDLGITVAVDIDAILDVAKEVAHRVQRPAAPVTTYLVGLAVGAGMPVSEAVDRVLALADRWPAQS